MNIRANYKKIVLAIIAIAFYIGLPVLILVGVIPFSLKFHVLVLGGGILYIFSRCLGFSNKDVGITFKNTFSSIKDVVPITMLLMVIALFLYFGGYSRMTPNESNGFYLFYLFVSSPVQELIYRGISTCFCREFHLNDTATMVLSSVLYSFVHIIYCDFFTLVVTFLMGLAWFSCYKKTKNLVGVSISHAVLGALTIVAGIID